MSLGLDCVARGRFR